MDALRLTQDTAVSGRIQPIRTTNSAGRTLYNDRSRRSEPDQPKIEGRAEMWKFSKGEKKIATGTDGKFLAQK